MDDGTATIPVDTMSSERETIPSSPPTRTILGQHQNVQPNTRRAYSNYLPLNSEFAVEDMSLTLTKQLNADDIDKENIEFIKSKGNTMDFPAAPCPRSLPKTPLVNPKADDDNLDKIRGGHALDALIGGMLNIVKSGGATPEPADGSVAVNYAVARGAAFLGSLPPRWAENHGIAPNKTDQEGKYWVDKAVADHKAEAAARMERFLAGGDKIVAINDQPLIDLDQAEAPKPKKKNKNKMSSKKKRQMKARKATLEGVLTSAEPQHHTPQYTTNVTDEKIPSNDASTAAEHEHEHDASLHAMDENSTIYKNEKPEDASTSAEQNTPQYTAQENTKIHLNDRSDEASTSAGQDTPQYTTQENSELYTNKRSAMEEKAIADAMTDSAIRVVMTSKKGKEQIEDQVHQTVAHEAGASDSFKGQQIANANDFLNFFNGKIEQHDKLFVEMEGLIQSLVAEIRRLHGLSGKSDKVVDDLWTLFTRILDIDTRGRMNRHAIRELKTSVVEHEGATSNGSDQPVMHLAGPRSIYRDAKQLQAGAGSLRTSEIQKLASTPERLKIELNEAARMIDNDISKYGEINSQIQSSIKTVKTDIVSMQRTSKTTKWEPAEVVNAVTDNENVRVICDTLHQIVEAAHNVPTLQQAFAKYGHAMKEIENASAMCDELKEIVDYNSDAVKKRNDEVIVRLDQQAEKLNKHGERLKSCHRLYADICDVVKKQEGHLNTLDNKVRAHQKLIAKVTSQSDSSARHLHSHTETTARDIKALSESTSREIKSLSEATSRDIKDTFEQLKETQVQLGTLKTTVDSQAGTLASKAALGEQKIKDIVMHLLDAIASKIDRICAKIEAYLGPLDHLTPKDDGSPKPKKLTHAQKNNQKRAIAVTRASVETQQTSVPATRDANSAAQTEISGTSPDAESEVKVSKVRMPQIDRIRPESMSETPAAASPAPIAPHPSPPSRPVVPAQPPLAMQILKCPEQRSPSLARSERHPKDGPFPERVAVERRNSMQRRDSMVFGNGMAGQGMMSPMAMDRVMMAPQNTYGEVYGQGQMVVAQQQVVYNQQQMVTAPPPGFGSQQTGLLPQMFGQDYDQEYGQQQSGQQQFSQQFCQAYDQQNDPQLGFGHDFAYQIRYPLAIIPVDENIQPAAYIPQQDPRDHQLMLLTYNMDNLNARVNEATNAMSVAQSSIRNLRMGLRYEISQDVELEVERRVGTALNGTEARLVQDINRRMNNTERRLNDRSTRAEKRLVQMLPMLEQLIRRDGLELPPSGRNQGAVEEEEG